ncbi:FG-GAP-like repeat-containing protein [Lutibacter sp.]|uniref:FG-GAP-like repeat-containing protein n=1 Tax=Lutibacter sp. TaxID=1925666 RepID=UPI0027372BEB|nr:FG-GAP-like repeat-containing protein [Lutibacter sp.]MDP3313709.1 FG-GAP-like repeat-containing protein [Lutibacter sp.]
MMLRSKNIRYYIIIGGLLLLQSCNKATKNSEDKLFKSLSSDDTGLDFTNEVMDTKDLNIFSYRNFYNGAGVGIGDINNDGLPDIYMVSNLGSNKLFLNEGNLKFKDISETSGSKGTHAWSTGVVMVDVNNDGYLDIYVSNAGNVKGDNRKNELFINNRDLTFTEQAAKYGLDDDGFTTHATFFDYDGDGDLDVYILNNSFIPVNTLEYANQRNLRDKDWLLPELFKGGGDKLLKNDNGKFVDVSEEAGIYGSLIGFGLGVVVGDVNNDLLPDIYVCNDFYERDYLYINQGNGTFKDEVKEYMAHLTMSSMGADIADINNDGLQDIYVADMLQEEDKRLKELANFDSYFVYQLKVNRDFHHQYMQNTLQLNNGNNTFSEIGFMSNTAETDWSWSPLIFDMDNDGYKDIYVTNGLYHDLTNQDFLDYFANSIIQKMALTGKKEELEAVISKMPSTPIMNYAFKNNQNLTFTNMAEKWGFSDLTFSNGASYADLDNDGDLDLIVSNVNQKMLAYENTSNTKSKNSYLKVKLFGTEKNKFGVGTTVKLFVKGNIFTQECMPSRGFQSSVDYVLNFGLGNFQQLDSLKVVWPNKNTQTIKNVAVNKTINLKVTDATEAEGVKRKEVIKTYFSETNQQFGGHEEENYIDFNEEGLVPFMLSKEGPSVAVGDINGDGLEDLFIGGAKQQSASIYMQNKVGKFVILKNKQLEIDSYFEDTAAAFFDADGDGDLDLYVGSGGNEVNSGVNKFKDRLYINDGKGNFLPSTFNLPTGSYNTSVIAPCDFDKDGDVDLFVGNRSLPGVYGLNPPQYLLQNNGKGDFKDITDASAYKIKNIGMVTDAKWHDFTGNGFKDLVLAGDWMSPSIFKNDGTSLSVFKSNLDQISGAFNCIEVADLDNDGDVDIVLGNRGNNSFYKANETQPVKMFVNDFDNNGSIEQVLTRIINGKDIPVSLYNELVEQIPSIKNLKLTFADYATKSIDELFSKEILESTSVKTINTFNSLVLINTKNNFEVKPLPVRAQMSTINNILVFDVNKDGKLDIITSGNNFGYKTQFTRQDASYGDVYFGDGKGGFSWQPHNKTGFFVKGQIRGMKLINKEKGTKYLITAPNNDIPKLFKYND